ncbi:MAG: flagellin [Bryobacteraceae bacterium]
MISLQTNIAALYGEQNLNQTQMNEQNTVEQLTSGYRINSSADDPAGLAIANALRSQETELTQGVQNGNDGVSQLQIIDGGLSNISQILDSVKTLVVQGASSTFTGDYGTLANEITSDLTEIDRQANNIGMGATATSFVTTLNVYIGGGLGTSNGGQIGVAAESINLSASTAGTAALGLTTVAGLGANSTAGDFSAAVAGIESAVVTLGKIQGAVGEGINQLNFAVSLAQSQITNYTADESGIRDADIASAAANLSKYQTLTQSSMAALAQANQMPQAVLKLLQ